MASHHQTPRLGDIVLLKQGIGVIRYHGNVEFDDEDTKYFGVELKGPSISGGHNGSYNGKKYFETTGGDGRGIFVTNILRIISSEEILEKLAEIYDILKGRNKHSHFIDRATYEDLSEDHNHLKQELEDKLNEIKDLNMDLSLLKEQINVMKGTMIDKIEETATLNGKINRAENRFGARLSQVDLSTVQRQLQAEEQQQQQQNGVHIPDYAQTTNTTQKKGHRKQRSSTTIALDALDDNFSDIAKNVSSYGIKTSNVSGPTHYRKFSNTTKMIMDQHKNGNDNNGNSNGWTQMNGNNNKGHKARESMKIGDIVDEHGIDFDDDEDEQLERQSNDEKDEESQPPQRQNKSRASRESRQLNDDEIKNEFLSEIEQEVQERESNEEEEEEEEEEVVETPKRSKKNRSSRESRQLQPHEYDQSVSADDDNIDSPKRMNKSRSSRESRKINPQTDIVFDDDDLNEYEVVNDDNVQKPKHKARGSVQIESSVLSSSALETHNEHHMEEEAAQINGPKDDVYKHKKSDTMTSDSSAYRAFMSVD